jgi:hypothetical protein
VDGVGFTHQDNFIGLVYLSDYTETPYIMMGLETEAADYAFLAQATELIGQEDSLNMGIDLENGAFILNSSTNTDPGTYDVYVLRIDDQGEAAFGASGLVLAPNTTVYLQYLAWTTNGQPMLAEVDNNDDGTIDETFELPDTTDEFIWE